VYHNSNPPLIPNALPTMKAGVHHESSKGNGNGEGEKHERHTASIVLSPALPHYFPTPPHSSLLVPTYSFSKKPCNPLENGAAAWD
jgi:hypothetical protein